MKLARKALAAATAIVLLAATACVLMGALPDAKLAGLPAPVPLPAPPEALARKVKLALVTSDAVQPVGIVAIPGEPPGRLFVIEKHGRVRVLRGGRFEAVPFLDIPERVSLTGSENGEQGLLGLAFHPRHLENRRVFAHFTDDRGDTRVIELQVAKSDPPRADPASERVLLAVDQPFKNHNAGNLEFGPDGKLYVLLGDGGKAGDPYGLAQNPSSLLGKALRFDVDAVGPAPEILWRGLRNPWRYTFDLKTGDFYIADVGQNLFEWVHVVAAADVSKFHNFGWNVVEGSHCFKNDACDKTGFVAPVAEYSHKEGCSITGGYVYRGKAIPELAGHYFYSDYCTALLRSFRWQGGAAGAGRADRDDRGREDGRTRGREDGRITDHWDWKAALDPEFKLAKVAAFGEDQEGELYVVSHEGPIYKLGRR